MRLSLTTTGSGLDPDGYTYALDGNAPGAVGPNESITVTGLDAGQHDLVIGGIAPNCTLAGGTARTIALVQADTTDIVLTVTCEESSPRVVATAPLGAPPTA
jgi:hypothetical protein